MMKLSKSFLVTNQWIACRTLKWKKLIMLEHITDLLRKMHFFVPFSVDKVHDQKQNIMREKNRKSL